MKERILADLEAEEAVLGSILLDPSCLEKVVAILGENPQVFYKTAHKAIYEAILRLYQEDQPIDVVSVGAWLKKKQKDNLIGGLVYLYDLVDSTPTAANVEFYAERVREMALRREMIAVGREIVELARDEEEDVFEAIDGASRKLVQLFDGQKTELPPLRAHLLRTIKEIDEMTKGERKGLASGFPTLDYMTGGWGEGDYVIIAGRPSTGKTSFALNIAYNVASGGCGVIFFSFEMTETQLCKRLLAAVSKVSFLKIKSGALTDEEMERVVQASREIENLPLHILYCPGFSILKLKSLVKREKLQNKSLKLVVVDYIQQIAIDGKRESRQQEVSEISNQLKLLAGEAKVVVLAISQLNRAVETRQNKRPLLSDLRESGSLEQDADFVGFLFREDESETETELIIRKQRNGPTGTVYLRFIPSQQRFIEDDERNKTSRILMMEV